MEVINYECPDPVHQEDGKWYFWSETWADRQGPYDTEENARFELVAYCQWLDTGERQ